MIRKTVHYTGRVQGVGFRATTANLAQRFDVAGYVQNLRDGRVRLDVQGAPDQVDGLVQAVARTLANNITKQHVDDSPPDDQLGDPAGPDAFGIRY